MVNFYQSHDTTGSNRGEKDDRAQAEEANRSDYSSLEHPSVQLEDREKETHSCSNNRSASTDITTLAATVEADRTVAAPKAAERLGSATATPAADSTKRSSKGHFSRGRGQPPRARKRHAASSELIAIAATAAARTHREPVADDQKLQVEETTARLLLVKPPDIPPPPLASRWLSLPNHHIAIERGGSSREGIAAAEMWADGFPAMEVGSAERETVATLLSRDFLYFSRRPSENQFQDSKSLGEGAAAVASKQQRDSAPAAAPSLRTRMVDKQQEFGLKELLGRRNRQQFLNAMRYYSAQKTTDRREPQRIIKAASETLPTLPLYEDLECGGEAAFTPVYTSDVDPLQCRVFGPGLLRAAAGELAQFTIRAVSKEGIFLRRGGTLFKVYIEAVRANMGRKKNTLKRKSEDKQCASGDENYLKAPTGADEMTDSEYDSEADKKQQWLPLSDRSAHRRRKDTLDAHVYDNEDGTYAVTYSCRRAVSHAIYIYLDDKKPVGASPYIVVVEPGPVCASACEAYGDGTRFFACAGGMNEIFVQARDAFFNEIKQGGADFKVISRGAAKHVETHDFHDGRYWITYFVPSGAEDNFVEISVLHKSKHIAGSPFRLKPLSLPEAPMQKTVLDTNVSLINPSNSLAHVLDDFHKKCGDVDALPSLSIFPLLPFKSKIEHLHFQPGAFENEAAFCAATRKYLKEATKQLIHCGEVLLQREKLLAELMDAIKLHGDVGVLHHNMKHRQHHAVDRLTASVAQLQTETEIRYKSIQHGVLDTLPVAFEIEDPEIVKAVHKERRNALLERHRVLKNKENELRQKEDRYRKERLRLVSSLAEEIIKRRQALDMQRAALTENTRYLRRLTGLNLKRHLRREMLVTCEPEAVEAAQSHMWHQDANKLLQERPLVIGSVAAAARKQSLAASSASAVETALPGRTQLPAVRPEDPSRPATWLYRGDYCSTADKLYTPEQGLKISNSRIFDLFVSSPTCVAYTEGKVTVPPHSAATACTAKTATAGAVRRAAGIAAATVSKPAAVYDAKKSAAVATKNKPSPGGDAAIAAAAADVEKKPSVVERKQAAAAPPPGLTRKKCVTFSLKSSEIDSKEKDVFAPDFPPEALPSVIYISGPPLPPPDPPPRRL